MTANHRRAVLLAALLNTLAVGGPATVEAQSRNVYSYALFAIEELHSEGLHVARGDLGVNDGTLFVSSRGVLDAPTSAVSADVVQLPPGARCAELNTSGAIATGPSCPTGPAFTRPFADAAAVEAACGFPSPLPPCGGPGTDVTVNGTATRTLEPGAYGDVLVAGGDGASPTLVLHPGTYSFCSFRARNDAQIRFEGSVVVYVRGTFRASDSTVVATTAALPGDVFFYVGGGAVRFSHASTVRTHVCAPNAILVIARASTVEGTLVARSIRTGDVTAAAAASMPTVTTSTSTTRTTTTSSTTSSSTSTTRSTTTSTSTTSSTSSSSTTSTSSSTTSSTAPPRCGDGLVNQPSEECDDGNDVDGDCCSRSCRTAPDGQPCGDGNTCNGDEVCQVGVCAPPMPAAEVACLAPRAIGFVSNFGDASVSLLSTAADTIVDTITVGRGAWGVAFHPRGTEIYVTARESNSVTVIDTAANAVTTSIPVGRLPLGVVIDPSGTRAYVATFHDNRVSVIDTSRHAVVGTIPVGKGPSGLTFGPGGTQLYVSNYAGNQLSVIDVATQEVVSTVPTRKRPLEMAVDAQRGRLYLTAYGADTVSVLGTVSNTVLANIRVGRKPFGVALDPTRSRAYVTNAVSGTVSVIEGDTCSVATSIPVGRGPLGVSLDLAGRRAYVTNSSEGTLSILDTTANVVTATLQVGELPVGFGTFVGVLPNTCARAPIECDDANPFTVDACGGAAGTCTHTRLAAAKAAEAGLATLDGLLTSAPPGTIGDPQVASSLGRFVGTAEGELAGTGTPRKQLGHAARQMRRFVGAVREGLRRRTIRCEIGLRMLDVGRGTHTQMRHARRSPRAGTVR